MSDVYIYHGADFELHFRAVKTFKVLGAKRILAKAETIEIPSMGFESTIRAVRVRKLPLRSTNLHLIFPRDLNEALNLKTYSWENIWLETEEGVVLLAPQTGQNRKYAVKLLDLFKEQIDDDNVETEQAVVLRKILSVGDKLTQHIILKGIVPEKIKLKEPVEIDGIEIRTFKTNHLKHTLFTFDEALFIDELIQYELEQAYKFVYALADWRDDY
ncbi:MAG: hypothetical protein QXE80_09130 [Pyrobaculum sp.]